MKECQFCKEDIKEAAKVCPYCHKRQKTDTEIVALNSLKTIMVGIIALAFWLLIFSWIGNLLFQ